MAKVTRRKTPSENHLMSSAYVSLLFVPFLTYIINEALM